MEKCRQVREADSAVLYEKGREVMVGKKASMDLGSHDVPDAVLMGRKSDPCSSQGLCDGTSIISK